MRTLLQDLRHALRLMGRAPGFTAAALATIGLALGWASSAAVGGFLAEWAGFRGIFLVGSVSALISAALLALYARANRASAAAQASATTSGAAAAPVQTVPITGDGSGSED